MDDKQQLKRHVRQVIVDVYNCIGSVQNNNLLDVLPILRNEYINNLTGFPSCADCKHIFQVVYDQSLEEIADFYGIPGKSECVFKSVIFSKFIKIIEDLEVSQDTISISDLNYAQMECLAESMDVYNDQDLMRVLYFECFTCDLKDVDDLIDTGYQDYLGFSLHYGDFCSYIKTIMMPVLQNFDINATSQNVLSFAYILHIQSLKHCIELIPLEEIVKKLLLTVT